MINVFPRKTEKAYGMSLKNIYVFDVPATTNRKEIVEAVEAQFDVKIAGIRTLVQKGKAIRYSRGKRAYPGSTNRKDSKKAYITLVKGSSIKIFDEPSETDAKPEKKKEKK